MFREGLWQDSDLNSQSSWNILEFKQLIDLNHVHEASSPPGIVRSESDWKAMSLDLLFAYFVIIEKRYINKVDESTHLNLAPGNQLGMWRTCERLEVK